MEIESYLGFGNVANYSLNDEVIWMEGRQPQNGGRPLDGTGVFDGYAVCPLCHLDFFTHIIVIHDHISYVTWNWKKPGFVE